MFRHDARPGSLRCTNRHRRGLHPHLREHRPQCVELPVHVASHKVAAAGTVRFDPHCSRLVQRLRALLTWIL